MSVIYDDGYVEVVKGVSDMELAELIKETIKRNGKPMSIREIKNSLPVVVSEDKVRKVLKQLVDSDELIEFPDATFGFAYMVRGYVPRRNVRRVQPLSPEKYYKMWYPSPSFYRKIGKPIEEAMKIAREIAREYGHQ